MDTALSGDDDWGGGGSLYRQRRWDGSRKDVVKIDDFHVAKRRKSYEGEGDDLGEGTVVSTDDGYSEVFETPTEAKRMDLDGRGWETPAF